MTELEKDINNLRSGLKSVESVSHADLRDKSRSVMYLVSCIFALTLAGCLYAGARLPEKAAAGAGRQVCVGGEPVHHCGQFQLLWRGGLPHRGQGAGKSPPLLRSFRAGDITLTLRRKHRKLASRFLSAAVATRFSDPIGHLFRKAHSRSEVLQLPATEPLMLY